MSNLNHLIEQAVALSASTLEHMRSRMPETSWDFEFQVFGVEDPAVIAARQKAEEAPEEPSKEKQARGTTSWRELFRKNWPENWKRRRRH